MDKYRVSKTRFAKALMPSVGDIVGNGYRVMYSSYSQFRFSVLNSDNKINMGDIIEHNGAIFKATIMSFSPNRATFEFSGFKDMPQTEKKNEAVKVDFDD